MISDITDHFEPMWFQPPPPPYGSPNVWTANVCMDHTLFMRSILVSQTGLFCGQRQCRDPVWADAYGELDHSKRHEEHHTSAGRVHSSPFRSADFDLLSFGSWTSFDALFLYDRKRTHWHAAYRISRPCQQRWKCSSWTVMFLCFPRNDFLAGAVGPGVVQFGYESALRTNSEELTIVCCV